MRVTIGIDNNKIVKVLPVIQADSVAIDYGTSLNQNLDSAKYGTIKVLGKEPLATVDINSFFPGKNYSFVNSEASSDALSYVRWFRNNRRDKKTMRVVITDKKGRSIFNRLMALETFSIDEVDQAGNYYYSMHFEQYRQVK